MHYPPFLWGRGLICLSQDHFLPPTQIMGSPSLESLTAWPQPDLFPYIRGPHTLLSAGTWGLLPASWGWLGVGGHGLTPRAVT